MPSTTASAKRETLNLRIKPEERGLKQVGVKASPLDRMTLMATLSDLRAGL